MGLIYRILKTQTVYISARKPQSNVCITVTVVNDNITCKFWKNRVFKSFCARFTYTLYCHYFDEVPHAINLFIFLLFLFLLVLFLLSATKISADLFPRFQNSNRRPLEFSIERRNPHKLQRLQSAEKASKPTDTCHILSI